MPETWRGPDNHVPLCPDCQKELSFVGAWAFGGLWGYSEVRTYECPAHGPIFLKAQLSIEHGRDKGPDKSTDNGDRDSLIPAARKPTPTLNADAIAIPEPPSN
jgi:hypothetical protein